MEAADAFLNADPNYIRSFQDFDDISKTEFFDLGNLLGKNNVPNIRLNRRKSEHRFGILQLLAKRKVILKIESGELTKWKELKWRPIQSYYNYLWGPWLSHIGQTFTSMSRILFPQGDGVDNPRMMQRKLAMHNKLHLGEPGQY